MARLKGLKSVRTNSVMVRLTDREKAQLLSKSKKIQLPMEAYIRCKIFDLPFEAVGGLPAPNAPGKNNLARVA